MLCWCARKFSRCALCVAPGLTQHQHRSRAFGGARRRRRYVCAAMCSAPAAPGRHRCAQLGRSRRTAARHNLRSSRSSRRCGEQRGATCFSAAALCSVAVRMSRRVAPRIARHAAARHHACAVCGLRFLMHWRAALGAASAPVNQHQLRTPRRGAQRRARRGAVRGHCCGRRRYARMAAESAPQRILWATQHLLRCCTCGGAPHAAAQRVASLRRSV